MTEKRRQAAENLAKALCLLIFGEVNDRAKQIANALLKGEG